jgi:hypothetical protein
MKKLIIMIIIAFLLTITYTQAYEIWDFIEMLKNWVDVNDLINDNNSDYYTDTYDNYIDDYWNSYWQYGNSIWNTHTNSTNTNWQNSNDILSNWFTRELNDAYNFAYEYWITTQNSIYNANMYGNLTRIAMAKMLSEYAINVLWYYYDNNQICDFADISYDTSNAYSHWDCKAFALWIMGQNLWNNQFRPFDIVTRAEFATALSRLLYNTPDWYDVYYSTHLSKLYDEWIISNTNPDLHELRWYIMLMLMRATNN